MFSSYGNHSLKRSSKIRLISPMGRFIVRWFLNEINKLKGWRPLLLLRAGRSHPKHSPARVRRLRRLTTLPRECTSLLFLARVVSLRTDARNKLRIERFAYCSVLGQNSPIFDRAFLRGCKIPFSIFLGKNLIDSISIFGSGEPFKNFLRRKFRSVTAWWQDSHSARKTYLFLFLTRCACRPFTRQNSKRRVLPGKRLNFWVPQSDLSVPQTKNRVPQC